MKLLKSYLFTLLFLTIGASVSSQQTPLPDEVVSSVTKRVNYGQNPSIAIGIIDKDGPRYYNFGTIRNGGEAVDEHSIYEIGSITKVFTGILLAKEVVRGNMALEDPVDRYLPEEMKIPYQGEQPISLGHLSDHTSGLPRMPTNFNPANPANPYVDYTVDQMLDFVSSYTPTRDVGEEYEYSNLAQGLLGYLLANKAELSYEELVKKEIISPLKMKETGITLTDEMKENLAIGHNNGREVENWDLTSLAGAGAIRSSTSDMLQFLSANLGYTETNFQKALELAMTKRHTKAGEGVGLGWHLAKSGDDVVFWHNGGTGGYRAYAGIAPDKGLGVVAFTNSTTGVDDIGAYLLGVIPQLREVKPMLASEIAKRIDNKGVAAAWEYFEKNGKDSLSNYDASESSLNNLGYDYMSGDLDAALAVFKMNIQLYPESFNVYDSYGEALLKKGKREEAIENYKKSVDLNPGNTNGIEVLKDLGITVEEKIVTLEDDLLKSYEGVYAVQPTFKITITKEGSQLYAQATGQPRFEIYPSSETEFYLKVVQARIVFNKEGEAVSSFTLYQNGAEVKAIKD